MFRKKEAIVEQKTPSRALVPWGGERVEDIDRFWAEAWIDLLNRQRYLSSKMKLAKAPWVVDQNSGLIQFDRADGALVTAPVQIVGSWDPRSSIFTWGWDHPSVQTRLRADAERTRWFGEKHAQEELVKRTVKMSEQEAWRLTAVAMKVNGAAGAYRGPTEGPVVFMTLGQPKVRA